MALTAIDLEPAVGSQIRISKEELLGRFALNGEEPVTAVAA